MVPGCPGIHEDSWRSVQRRHHQIERAVIIEVSESRAALISSTDEVRAQTRGDIAKHLAMLVQKQRIMLSGIRTDVIDVAVRRIDVLPSVVVDVREGHAPSRKRAPNTFNSQRRGTVCERLAVNVTK